MNTRTLALGGRFTHVAQWPTPTFFLIEASAQDDVVVQESAWQTSDESMAMTPWTDLYGNRGQKLILPAGESVVEWSARVTVPDAVVDRDVSAEQMDPQDLPDDVLTYLWPSRYAQSDVLSRDAWRLFGNGPRTLQRALDVSDYVYKNVTYRTGSTMSWWTAVDAFNNGYGICRDLSHTFVALCRALNIPARYVSGYLPDMDVPALPTEMDFHAWSEVFMGGRWWTVDARHNAARKGHVKIGHGRDAADVALATTFGSPWLKRMIVTCHEVLPDGTLAHGGPATV